MIKRAWCVLTRVTRRTATPRVHTRRGPLPGPQAGRRATPPPPRDTQHRGLGRRGKAHHDRRCEGEKDLPRHSHYSGVIPMVFQHSERWAKKTLVQLEGKQGERGPDFDDDGYKYMICVEPAVARPSAPVELAIGESWTEGELLWSFSRELTKSLHEDVMDTCTSMISCGRGCGAFASIARK